MSGAITGVCSRFMGELLHALGGVRSALAHNIDPINPAACKPRDDEALPPPPPDLPVDDLMLRALTAVFGMENNGRINKEKARQVVEKLGLVEGEEEASNFDLPGGGRALEDEVPVEEVLGRLAKDASQRHVLLRQAFRIFDEDGNGFIDALELKRVLQCLGLDNGWDMGQIEKMLKIVDLNLDGKVDFSEFEMKRKKMSGEREKRKGRWGVFRVK